MTSARRNETIKNVGTQNSGKENNKPRLKMTHKTREESLAKKQNKTNKKTAHVLSAVTLVGNFY